MEKKQENLLAMWCNLGLLLPNASVIVPLIIWLLKKDESPFVNESGKKAINFCISIVIYAIVPYLLVITVMFAIIGLPLLIALAVFAIVCIVIASVKTYHGEEFSYPLCIPFIK